MSGLFTTIVTGIDNQTHDLGRWSWIVCTFSVIVHEGFNIWKNVPTDIEKFAMALGIVVAAHGAALGFKAKTEPGANT